MRKIFSHRAKPFFTSAALLLLGIAVLFSFPTPLTRTGDSPKLKEVLVQGQWQTNIDSSGGLGSNYYIYIFSSNGTYTQQAISDSRGDPSPGRWRFEEDTAGKTHLIINDDAEECYWLPCNVVVEYDWLHDVLLVSGGSLIGKPTLEHIKQH